MGIFKLLGRLFRNPKSEIVTLTLAPVARKGDDEPGSIDIDELRAEWEADEQELKDHLADTARWQAAADRQRLEGEGIPNLPSEDEFLRMNQGK